MSSTRRRRAEPMIVREFMTPRVIAIAPDASLADAAKLMLENKVSGLPVVDARRHVVGIVSEHDLLRRCEGNKDKQGSHWMQLMIEGAGLDEDSARFSDRRVRDVMTASPITVAPTSSLGDACRIIAERGIKRLPVVENGELVGVVARADLVRCLAEIADSVAVTTAQDDSVSDQLRELERQVLKNRARGLKPF